MQDEYSEGDFEDHLNGDQMQFADGDEGEEGDEGEDDDP
jgi:hypothetical protein